MPLHPSWTDILVRLVLTMLACGLIGFNREAHGHAAGLRTTMLVGLAAAVAMVQANLMLPTDGKTPGSFSVLDLMRLPLGILTGVGFIGAGAIMRRGDLITGVTTAATLWAVTVISLCFGGGQIGLGVVGTAIGSVTLWVLKWVDRRISRDHRATLSIEVAHGCAAPSDLPNLLRASGYTARLRQQQMNDRPGHLTLTYDVSWRSSDAESSLAGLVDIVNHHYPRASLEIASV